MPIAAGWAVIALLACLAMVVDNTLDSGPHVPLWIFVVTLASALPALIGAAFGVADSPGDDGGPHEQINSLLGRVSNPIRAGLLLATLVAAGVAISGVTYNPTGNSVRLPDGSYALEDKKNPPPRVVSEAVWRRNSRAERRVFLGGAIFVNAWGGALCWAVKLRDDEEDPL